MVDKKQDDYPDLFSPAPVLKQWFIKSSSEKIQDHYVLSEKEVWFFLPKFKIFHFSSVWAKAPMEQSSGLNT
jgi:hypothetical protein